MALTKRIENLRLARFTELSRLIYTPNHPGFWTLARCKSCKNDA